MSSSESDSTVDRPEPLVVLSHLVHRLLKREGGSVPLERVTLRVSDYVDIGDQEAPDLMDAGASERVFTLGRGTGGSTTIVGVSPQGSEPAVITEAFCGPAGSTETADFQSLEVVTESIAAALRDAGDAPRNDCSSGETVTLTRSATTATSKPKARPNHEYLL